MILEGDCIERMAEMDEASVDAIVTDPPYSLSFMGKDWDKDLNHGPWATEALRVLKPGGHLLAFGGTRTYHRLACAIEDAGFEIRDSLIWIYGSGFPKSLDVSKAIDKAAGAEREETMPSARHGGGIEGAGSSYELPPEPHMLTAPATPEAVQWEGWGTALKPGHEPIVVARKPLSGTVAQNVLEHGTGALNIDGCRIEGEGYAYPTGPKGNTGNGAAFDGTGLGRREEPVESHPLGRWPANVVLSPEAAEELDEQSGDVKGAVSNGRRATSGDGAAGIYPGESPQLPGYGDSGGASRFFYQAKASRGERNAGLEGFEERLPDNAIDRASQREGLEAAPGRGSLTKPMANVHPTVKPIDLMRWLVRLVTPPGGTCLDPFTGSGTTGIAAVLEGFDFIGIERESEYAEIAKARIAFWEPHAGRDTEDVLIEAGLSERIEREHREAGQLGLLDGANPSVQSGKM